MKAQANKDVANYEAEWRQLTDIVEQDRRSREAQRQREITAREQHMAALFKQEFARGSGCTRRPSQRLGASSGGPVPTDEAVASEPERVTQLKEAFDRVLAATGELRPACATGCRSWDVNAL